MFPTDVSFSRPVLAPCCGVGSLEADSERAQVPGHNRLSFSLSSGPQSGTLLLTALSWPCLVWDSSLVAGAVVCWSSAMSLTHLARALP